MPTKPYVLAMLTSLVLCTNANSQEYKKLIGNLTFTGKLSDQLSIKAPGSEPEIRAWLLKEGQPFTRAMGYCFVAGVISVSAGGTPSYQVYLEPKTEQWVARVAGGISGRHGSTVTFHCALY